MPASNLPLVPRCAICESQKNLFQCQNCNLVDYCSKDHQFDHIRTHKISCRKVQEAQAKLHREEQKLQAYPGDMYLPANPFETFVGRFGSSIKTQDYLSARYALMKTILEINTFAAAQSAYDHVREVIRLNRWDHMNVRIFGPSLLLRLGRDQECYDFVRWYSQSYYHWSDREFPLFDVAEADAFESVDFLCQDDRNLNAICRQIATILLKIRLLLDLRSLQHFPTKQLTERLPREIVDMIRVLVPQSAIIRENKEIQRNDDHSALVEKLEQQIKKLFYTVDGINRYFWTALLSPATLQRAPEGEGYSSVAIRVTQIIQGYTFHAWNETPGAIDLCKELWKSWQ